MAELADLLSAELARLSTPAPRVRLDLAEISVEQRRAALPLQVRQAISREAGPVGSREYRSAMRRLQRYVTGAGEIRRPSPRMVRQMARAPGAGRLVVRDTKATVTGSIWVSTPDDRRRRTVVAVIPAADMRPVATAFVAGDPEQAAARFWAAFRRAYSGVPLELESVERLRLDPGAAE